MKSILVLSSAAFGTSLRDSVLKSDPRSWSCFFDCVGTYFRGDVYCSYTWEFESEDYYRCLEPFKEELDQCVAVDGCLTLGPCWEKCTPPIWEGAPICEEGYANGDLNEREFFRCLIDLSLEAAICLGECDPLNP